MLKLKEQKILIILSIILLVFILFSASFFMVFFDKSFYDKSFKKYGIYEELGVLNVRNTLDYLINYLTNENTEINELVGFMPEEKTHLEDVKNIIIWLKALSIASFVLLIIFIMRLSILKDFKPNLKKIFIYGSISTLAVLIIIFVLSLNFPSFFDVFHKILFPQGNYMFPAHYLLIKLFPQELFMDFARKMFFHTGILSLILLFLGSSSALTISNTRHN